MYEPLLTHTLDSTTPFQFINIALCFLIFIIAGLCIKKYPKYWLLVLTPVTYIMHLLTFYSFFLYVDYMNLEARYAQDLNGWSTGIRLHLLLLVLGIFIFEYLGGDKWIQRQ
jgi:hypothetical protein